MLERTRPRCSRPANESDDINTKSQSHSWSSITVRIDTTTLPARGPGHSSLSLSSRLESVTKASQPYIRLKTIYDSRTPTFLIHKLTVNLLLTFVHVLVWQADHLPRKPAIQLKWMFEVNREPVDLSPAIECDIGQDVAEFDWQTTEKESRSPFYLFRRSGIGT